MFGGGGEWAVLLKSYLCARGGIKSTPGSFYYCSLCSNKRGKMSKQGLWAAFAFPST